jgi:hypothetical protein
MDNYAGIVAQVLASQFSDPVVSTAEEEDGKAQLTRAAAYEIAKTDPNVGLRRKTSGNQVAGLSVDTIVDRTSGQVVDIATSRPEGPGTVRILPGWYDYGNNPAEIPSYVQPTAALAALPGPMPPTGFEPDPGPGPGPGPSDDVVVRMLDEIIATQAVHTELLERARQQQAADTARLIENDNANTEKIQQQIHQVVEDAEASGKKLLALYLAGKLQPGSPTPDEVNRGN